MAISQSLKNALYGMVPFADATTELYNLLSLNDVTPGTATASKSLVLDASKGISTITSATITTLTTTTVTAAGAITSSSPSAGIGYATGAGSTVTQITNRSTGVTINAISGAITGDGTSLAAEATATFVVTNSAVAIGDVVAISVRSGPTSGATSFRVTAVAAGSFSISATNNNAAGGTADTGAPIINFAVIKAVSA